MAGDQGSAEGQEVRSSPLGVVFDTNTWRKGSLDLEKLSEHARRLEKRRIEVWVPYQVLLEWSEHAAADANAIAPPWKRLAAAGLAPAEFPLERNLSSLIEHMAELLSGVNNVRVLEMSGASAAAAIQDQILGTGAGSVKNGVKTGAADSSLIRDSLEAAGGDPADVVFVSRNIRDFRAMARSLGVELRTCTEEALYSSELPRLALATPPELWVEPIPELDEIAAAIETFMQEERQSALADYDGHTPPFESWLSVEGPQLMGAELDAPLGFEITDVEIRPEPEVLSIENVHIIASAYEEDDDGRPTGAYDLSAEFVGEFRADLLVHGYFLDNEGQLQHDTVNVFESRVTSPFIVDFVNGDIVSLEPSGPAYAELP